MYAESKQSSKELPLVSVIVPAYNAVTFIERTLKSILAQTYANFEVLVIDDGSQDNTAEIVQEMQKQDCRIILLQQANSGVAAARNLGIQKSRGDYIAPIDADDLWHPENLAKQVECLVNSDSSVGISYAWSADINENDQLTGEFRAAAIEGEVYKTLICHNFIGNASATVIRRTCLDKIGYFNCQLKAQDAQGCEDWELYLRIAQLYQFRVVPEFLIGYRKFLLSMSRDYHKMAKSHALMLQASQDKSPEVPNFLYQLSKSSFYLYLARQSHQYSDHQQTLFWLLQTLKAEWITPIFRTGLYILLIQSIGGIMIKSLGLSNESKRVVSERVNFCEKLWENFELSNKESAIKFKLLVGNSFHQLIKLI